MYFIVFSWFEFVFFSDKEPGFVIVHVQPKILVPGRFNEDFAYFVIDVAQKNGSWIIRYVKNV